MHDAVLIPDKTEMATRNVFVCNVEKLMRKRIVNAVADAAADFAIIVDVKQCNILALSAEMERKTGPSFSRFTELVFCSFFVTWIEMYYGRSRRWRGWNGVESVPRRGLCAEADVMVCQFGMRHSEA